MRDYIVPSGKCFNVGGDVEANLIVEEGGTALIGGNLLGSVLVRGSLVLAGAVHGNLTIEESGHATIGGAIQGTRDIRGGILFGGSL